MKLFVYGTLKSGYGNNKWCLDGAVSLGQAITHKTYKLLNGGFPIASNKGENKLPIIGEIFEINEGHLASCDSLEGHPSFYTRRTITAETQDGQQHEVFIYEMDREYGENVCDVVSVDGNDYYVWGR